MKVKKNIALPIKSDCHALINIIWNPKKPGDKGMSKAYDWLYKNTGIRHFADENDFGRLFQARKLLQAEAIERGLITIDDIV